MWHFYKTPAIIKSLSPNLEWDIPTAEKELYITFDDGPIPGLTPYVLETLKEFDARATFFCVGDNIRKHKDIFEKILEQSHAVGNHTYNHLKAWNCSMDKYLDNIRQCEVAIDHVSKHKPLFRPPHGQITPGLIRKLKKSHRIIMWDVLAYDYSKKHSAETSLQHILKNTRPGSIIVFHDNYKAEEKLKYMLPRFLGHFRERGFIFKNLHDTNRLSDE